MAESAGQSYLTGAMLPSGEKLINAVLTVHPDRVTVVYRQQLSAPYFMWTGGEDGYRAFLFDPAGSRNADTAFLLCYEIALPWRVLKNHLDPVNDVLFLSNIWWAAGTGIQATMLAHAAGWSRLFGVPYTATFNL
ncbi:MAG: hypothetical protein OXG56_05775 [Gammaproteobacteria bacterium]|nr:hypothetical protein [Gammaproteobacteria bacterium]